MTTHLIPGVTPNIVVTSRSSNNGQVPQAALYKNIATGLDHFVLYFGKCFFNKSENFLAVANPSVATDRLIWFAFGRTGATKTKIRHYIGLAQTTTTYASPTDPYAYVTQVTFGPETTVDSSEFHYRASSGATVLVGATDINHGYIETDVAANTEYYWTLRAVNYARPVYWMVTEISVSSSVDDTVDGAASPAPYLIEGPIYDAHHQELLETATYAWQRNAPVLLTWSARTLGNPTNGPDPSQVTSASYAQHTTSDEYVIPIKYHGTQARDVPMCFAVNALTAAGSTNAVQVTDADSGAHLMATSGWNSATQAWRRTWAIVDKDTRAVKIRLKSDGTNSFSVYAYTLFEYEGAIAAPDPTHSLDLERTSSQYAEVTDTNQNNLDITAAITCECWVKFESNPASGEEYVMVSKYNTTGNQRAYKLYLINNGGTQELRFLISDDGTNDHGRKVAWTPTAGTWYHVAGTYDPTQSGIANQFKIYINTTSQTLTTHNDDSATAVFNSSAALQIGSSNAGANFFDGLISDVRVWAVARTATQIAADDNNTTFDLTQKGLRSCWLRTNMYGDLTGSGNVLTPVATPVFSTDAPY